MNNILSVYIYIKMLIQITLYKIFEDDGRRYRGDYLNEF